jgi:hypothetical protein
MHRRSTQFGFSLAMLSGENADQWTPAHLRFIECAWLEHDARHDFWLHSLGGGPLVLDRYNMLYAYARSSTTSAS